MTDVTQAYVAFILSLLFVLATILVIRKSRTNVNIAFATGSFLFAIGTLLAGMGYYDASFQYLWTYATIAITLAPCGYFIAGKLIIDGDRTFRSIMTYIVIIIAFISSIATFIIYPTLNEPENVKRWDIVLIAILCFCCYQFYKVYQIAPELRIKLSFLLFGIVISILSLAINIVIIFLTGETTVLRTIIPAIGQMFIVASFTSIPDAMRRSTTNQQPQVT